MSPNLRAIPLAFLMLTLVWAAVPSETMVRPVEADDEEGIVHMRGWEIGDYWRFYKETAEGNPANTKGSILLRVQGVEQVTNDMFFKPHRDDPAWEKHHVYRVQVWANQTTNSANGPAAVKTDQMRYHRTSDLAYAQMESYSYIGFQEASPQRMDRIYEYYPPEVEIMFPFAVGDKWRMGTTLRSHDPNTEHCGGQHQPGCNATGQHVHTYTVLGKENLRLTIDGKSKEFLTYRIHVLNERGLKDYSEPEKKDYKIFWYAPEACYVVKEEHYNADKTLRERRILTDFKCTGKRASDPSYQIYDALNFSSTRLHGELAIPPGMQQVLDAVAHRQGPQEEERGSLLQIGENLPGPGAVAMAGVLVALAAIVQRRRVPPHT